MSTEKAEKTDFSKIFENERAEWREKIQVINKNAELPRSTIIKLKSDRDKYEKQFF